VTEPEESPILAYATLERPRTRADLPVNYRTILAIALPTLIEQLVTFGVRATDVVVAGRTGNDGPARAASAAAVGTMTYLQWFAALVTAAIGVGATAIVARSIGARRPRLANRVAGTACSASFLISACVALFFFLFPGAVVHLMGLHGQVEILARQYLQIMVFTVCFQSLSLIGNACLRGAGDTLRPMITTITSTVITVTVVPALSFGWFGLPSMGIRGNAFGTLAAFATAAGMTLIFLLSGSAGLKLQRRHFKIVPHMLGRVLKIGLPSGLENLLMWGGQVFIVVMATTRTDRALTLAGMTHAAQQTTMPEQAGTVEEWVVSGVTMAAHQATVTIESLAFLPGFGLGIACSALVGQYLGARKPNEAAHAVTLCQRLAVATMTFAALVMVFFPGQMLHLVVKSQEVINIGVVPLILAGLAQPAFAIQIIKSSSLRGAGDTISPMITTITGILLRVLLVAALLILFAHYGYAQYGLTAVWIAIFIDLHYRGFLNNIFYHRGKWKNQKV